MVNPVSQFGAGFPQTDTPFVDEGRHITDTWLTLLRQLFRRTGQSQGIIGFPGQICLWGGDTDPAGWYVCDNRQVAIASDPDLYAVIGDANGVAAPGFFRLPAGAGRTVVGAGGGFVRGQVGGSATSVIGQANLPAVNFPVTDPGHVHPTTDPGHLHASVELDTTLTAGATAGSAKAGNTGVATTGVTVDSATTGITVASGGAGTPLSTIGPYTVQNFIIKR